MPPIPRLPRPAFWHGIDPFGNALLRGCSRAFGLLSGIIILHAEPIPMSSAEATYHSGSSADLAHVIDENEAGPLGWSVEPEVSKPQALIIRSAKPVLAAELDISLYFLSGRPNYSIAEFDLSYTTDAEPSLDGNWEPLEIQRYAAEVANLSRLENGHLRSSGGPAGVNGVIPDDTYRIVAGLPGGRATGFRLRAYPLINGAGTPYAMSWSYVRQFMLTEFRVEEHIRATTNIALHCPVTSSHKLYGSMTPLALTDGLPATIAHPLDENLGATFHFDIDLGRVATFDHINLLGRGDDWTDRLSRVTVRIYDKNPGTDPTPAWEGLDRADGSHPGPGEHDVLRAGLGKGVFRGRYLRLSSDNPVPNSPQLAEVEVYESRTPEIVSALADGQEIPVKDGLDIPPGVQRLSLHLRIPQIGLPPGDVFRWRLPGILDKWQSSRLFAIDMPCPPAGRTIFEAQALHSDREWDATLFRLPIMVHQHYWETRLFQWLTGGLTLLTSVWLARILTKRRAARQLALARAQTALAEERTRIARDLHDDLGASLTRIMLLSNLAQEGAVAGGVGNEMDQIHTTAHELAQTMDEIVWAVDPEHDTLESLAVYLGRAAQALLQPAGLRCRLIIPADLPFRSLGSEVRHNLFLAMKETIHNIIKHAAATEVRLQMSVQADSFVLAIADNGRGFDAAAEDLKEKHRPAPDFSRLSSGNGLKNLRLRMIGIGGSCVVTSAPGEGTEVLLRIPI